MAFSTNIMPSIHVKQDQIDAKRLEKKRVNFLTYESKSRYKPNNCKYKHKRNRHFDCFGVRSNFVSVMNIETCI